MDRDQSAWLFDFVSKAWQYSLDTYGDMGPGRLSAIFHTGKYFGGHPSYYYDDSHDNRNVVDQGGGDWREGNYDVPSHEIAHIVESTASHTKYGSPAFGLWRDSKWAEFYQYDLYKGLGMESDAERVFNDFSGKVEDFPRPGTRWFSDWFHPLWRDYGGAQVMVRFYGLLGEHFPAQNQRMGSMNWGEYIHFTSGAAETDLTELATSAFGWSEQWQAELDEARAEFPEITY